MQDPTLPTMQLNDVPLQVSSLVRSVCMDISQNHKSQCLSGLYSVYSVQHPLSLDAQCKVREKKNFLAGKKKGRNLKKRHRGGIFLSINRATKSQKIQIQR